MFSNDQYELLDFGGGRKLERFGPLVLDRPCPAAEGRAHGDAPARASNWPQADGKFQRKGGDSGTWTWKSHPPPDDWAVAHGAVRLALKPTEFGHVGLFPEQAENWDWIARRVAAASRSLKILNLFAYTGGATLAAAAAGAEVTHVDGAKNVVAWARRNADLSGLADAPIRWIVEDAPRFVQREIRRGHQYDAIVLDPPSYGHGPKGEVWKLAHDLPPLLADCAQLVRAHPVFILLACHTPGFGPPELEALLSETLFGACGQGVAAGWLALRTAEGRSLPAGTVARWPT